MKALLERERARSDRTLRPFSLVTFRFDPPTVDRSAIATFARRVRSRLRITDDVGILRDAASSRYVMGMVLPETGAAGARTLADEVCQLCSSEFETINYDVYVYPRERSERDNIDKGGADNGKGNSNGIQRDPPRARPMEELFSKGLPVWKRVVDVCVATLALLVAIPLICLAGLLIQLTSRGPVFYSQRRTGLGGKPFSIYKLRTMSNNAEGRHHELHEKSEQDGPAFKNVRGSASDGGRPCAAEDEHR